MSKKTGLWVWMLTLSLFALSTAVITAWAPAGEPAPVREAGPPPGPARTYAPATVTVDASSELGALNNPGLYHNQSGPSQLLGPGDRRRVEQLRPAVIRAWFKPHSYYDEATGTYDFNYLSPGGTNHFYDYADQVSALASEAILANFDQCDQSLMTPAAPERCRAVLKEGIRHYKLRYPKLRYIELFNEPDKTWSPGPFEQPAIDVQNYYVWYRVAYSVVNEINEELRPEVPLRIGGPATYTLNPTYLGRFLDLYRADPDPRKRLDFLSYHQYRHRDDPAAVQREKATVRRWLSARGLDPNIPTFVTEYGIFPGTATGTTFEEDLLTQAAAMATLGYYYVQGGTDMTLHWVYDHGENDRKSMLVDSVDGAVYPYYNLVAMQRMLKSRRLKSTSAPLDAKGIGVNAIASRDRSGIAVLATNYQSTKGTADYTVTVRLDNLANEFRTGRIQVERYLIDGTTSNYAYDPAHADLQRVERYVAPAGANLAATFNLHRNAMSLLVLTPLPDKR